MACIKCHSEESRLQSGRRRISVWGGGERLDAHPETFRGVYTDPELGEGECAPGDSKKLRVTMEVWKSIPLPPFL
jgi:hypothetical protein